MAFLRRRTPFIYIPRMQPSDEGKRANPESGPKMLNTGKIGGEFLLQSDAPFLQARHSLFESLFSGYLSELSAKPKEPIKVTLCDGTVKEGVSWQTTCLDIARVVGKGLTDRALVGKVKYSRLVAPEEGLVATDTQEDSEEIKTEEGWELYDLQRPLEGDCALQLLTFEDPEGKMTFWHSSAHVLGASLERAYGSLLTVGPPLNPGFFYDSYVGSHSFGQEDYGTIEKTANEVVTGKFPFQRIVLDKTQALQLFSYNPFKTQLISRKIPDGGKTTAYRCGLFIDLCTGPHLPDTGKIRAFQVTKNSSAYWLGKSENDSLQRIYGVSFPSKKELAEYNRVQEELAKRDHRKIGLNQELFFWHSLSVGSTFFLPYGARIYNKLVEFIRKEYKFRGFHEVVSPNIYSCELWKISGHYNNYRDNLFMFDVEKHEWAIKPMNCPGHCLMFDHVLRSYKELPLRLADFGVLHRNELSGALGGLTRVRRFQQDDAHIFCRKDQITEEVISCLEFVAYVYGVLGFTFEVELSTRPEKAIGEPALWQDAEMQLAQALDLGGYRWKLNPGDGAFYGPKIDIQVYDAFHRAHQCGTIQLDFNSPVRFNLQYKSDSGESAQEFVPIQYDDFVEKPLKPGFERPVIIHRAILGSIERMYAILTESTGGKWPFWLSPRQIVILSINDSAAKYAHSVATALWVDGYYAESDTSNVTLNKKIRNAQLNQFNFIGVVGEQELGEGTVDIRDRDLNASVGKMTVKEIMELFRGLEPPTSPAEMRMRGNTGPQGEVVEIRETFGLSDLNEQLSSRTFVEGGELSQSDWRLFRAIKTAPDVDRFPHLRRWFEHMSSLKGTK